MTAVGEQTIGAARRSGVVTFPPFTLGALSRGTGRIGDDALKQTRHPSRLAAQRCLCCCQPARRRLRQPAPSEGLAIVTAPQFQVDVRQGESWPAPISTPPCRDSQ